MIQQEHIEDTHPARALDLKRLALSRAAADADLDRARWHTVQPDYPSPDAPSLSVKQKEFVPTFTFETAKSYGERLSFLSSPGWTQFVVDSFKGLFDSAERSLDIQGLSPEEEEHIRHNIDGQGSGVDTFASQLMRELLITDRGTVVTNRLAEEMPTAFILERELIMNYVHSGNLLNFMTYQGARVESEGISAERRLQIIIYTQDEIAVAEQKKNSKEFKVVESIENPFDFVPICDIFLTKGTPLVLSVAKLEHDFMNLKSEMRKILRDQAGLNILEVDHKVDVNQLSSTSLIKGNANDYLRATWVPYPSNSMDSQFQYWNSALELFQSMNRLRSQKTMAEAGVSKKLDFVNTEAVLNAIADKVELSIEKSIKMMGAWLGKEIEVSYDIDRSFDVSDINEDLDALLKIMGVGFGQTFENISKVNFAKKWGKIGDKTVEDIEKELEQSSPLLFEDEE